MQISHSEAHEQPHRTTDSVRVGDRVRVRRHRWVITAIRAHEDCSALTLTGIEPANLGAEQEILTPFDLVEPLTVPRSFRIVRNTRWRHTCRHLIAGAGPAGILQTARTARMDLMPHQLEPALAVVHGRGTRLLIADEVGLGKTVQAALVVAELRARRAASRVLILTPAGLREQWVDEFAQRFDLRLALFDSAALRHHRALLPIGLNPWSVEPLIVTSIDYVKRPEVGPAVCDCRWDVVIIDEAHHAAIGSDRHDVVQSLCRQAPYVILLTATPHNGDPQAFASLCALGQHGEDKLVVFRRTRQQVGPSQPRRIHQLRIRPSAEERRMHAALDAFVRAVQHEPDGREPSTWLALATLRKRALSSAYALQQSVDRRLHAIHAELTDLTEQLRLPIFDASGEFDADDEVPAWTVPPLRDSRRERELLSRVARAASAAVGRESKLTTLKRLLRRIAEPAIVFTEYRDTLRHVRDLVSPDATILHGGLSRDERQAALGRFTRGGILLATDAAGEGLNLHHNCRVVVNLELPWNPMRLEQRIGRVDRIGQRRRVHAFHLIAGGTAEVRVLQRLAVRVARAQAEVGTQNPLESPTTDAVQTMPLERLTAEASREHERLTLARRLVPVLEVTHEGFRDLDRHALVTFAKRRQLRRELGSQVVVLFRSSLSDASGRQVAYHLTPFSLRLQDNRRGPFRQLEGLEALVRNDRAVAGWLRSSARVHSAFWAPRQSRERLIATFCESIALAELQPGLFDLRAEQARNDEMQRRRDADRERTWLALAAAQAATLVTDSPEISLVLFTH